MKLYFIAGEASGDLHGANLIDALRKRDNTIQMRGLGGEKMEQAGCTLMMNFREVSFMGFAEVIKNIGTILLTMKKCKEDILQFKPDAIMLIDYPGFNLRMAKWAHRQGIRVFYYISPQVWAWKSSRVETIRQVVDKMFVILPFEKKFYADRRYAVEFVGHPLLDEIAKGNHEGDQEIKRATNGKKILALLPGSRAQEISKMLPVMLRAAEAMKNEYTVFIAGAPGMAKEFYQQFFPDDSAKILFNQTYALLRSAQLAAVTSGTATLETALHAVPQVVCYRGSAVSYFIGKQLVKIKFISLVNLIMEREVVKELIQNNFTAESLLEELKKITTENEARKKMLADYSLLREKLGGEGASARTADAILHALKKP